MKKLLVLPHIKIHNANALSSPFTIGFPAMTAWLGAAHALERQLNQKFNIPLKFHSLGIVSHEFDLQTYKGLNDYEFSIVGTGNPLDKEGNRSAFIEEARCHLEVSLVLEYSGIDISLPDEEMAAKEAIANLLNSKIKMAGGDILQFEAPFFRKINEDEDLEVAKFLRSLMLGYVLIERRDLAIQAMQEELDGLGAILDYLKIQNRSEVLKDGKVEWHRKRKTQGWIVPISVGFQGISALGPAKNQRDMKTPHRFAESVVTLGEFKMPHRIKDLDHMLWKYDFDSDNDLYLCQAITPFVSPEMA